MSASALTAYAPRSSRAAGRGQVALIGLATVVAATLANLLVYFIGDALIGYDPDFVVLATAGGTIFWTVTLGIGAVLVYAALLRFSHNPTRTFTIVSAVALILSIVPDFTYIPSVEGSSNIQIAILVLMHVVAAAVIVWMLTTLARPQGR